MCDQALSILALSEDEADLATLSREALTALVLQLRGLERALLTTLTEIIAERDAALLLNELCHY